MTQAFIGIGSNLADPLRQVQTAIRELSQLPNSTFLKSSSLYRTKPLGPSAQPDFINAVVALETALSPLSLLDALQALELQHGRVRNLRWGPRTLDLDLLLYEQLELKSARLILPHPGLKSRIFVLKPLAEIAPALILPSGESITTLLAQCDDEIIKLRIDLYADYQEPGF